MPVSTQQAPAEPIKTASRKRFLAVPQWFWSTQEIALHQRIPEAVPEDMDEETARRWVAAHHRDCFFGIVEIPD